MALLKHFHLLFILLWVGSLLVITTTLGLSQRPALEKWRYVYRWVDLPCMVLALLSGLILFIWKGVSLAQGWLHLKLTAVFLLVMIDLLIGVIFMRSRSLLSQKKGLFLRILQGGVLLLPMVVLFSVYVLKNK